jgi:ribosome biogenesis GTPase A
MEQKAQIQWFPGHMAKTRRKITESLSLVDVVTEVIDARIPVSSRNPELDTLTASKPRLIVLNKADMADMAATRRWMQYFKEKGFAVMTADCKTGAGIQKYVPLLRELLKDKLDAKIQKGMKNPVVRSMVVGIPNVGKSSFINRLTAGGKAKVEDRPGVTRNNQWFTVEGGVQLLDTPGVLWPKFEDVEVARHLAFTGAIKDQILDIEEMACLLLEVLRKEYASLLVARYKLSETDLPEDGWELLQAVGRKRGMLVRGGEIDTERAAIMLLDEYRSAKIGALTLEFPEDMNQ